METANPSRFERVRFGVFELDLRSRELRRQGVKIKLQEQPFQLLEVLLERPGDVVTREELRQRIWSSDTFVDFEGGLYNAAKKLREALGDTADMPRFIETLPRRGYRFIAPVTGAIEEVPAPAKDSGETLTASPRRSRRRLVVGLGSAALLVALLGLVFASIWRRLPSGRRGPQIRSVAVLPLKNLSADPSQEYLAYGMAEELITDLSQVRMLKVASHTSVLRYANSDKTVAQIARELGVDAVIEGAVQRSADRVRITAQLIDGSSDRNLWARTYDRDLSDVLALQSTVAKEIADEILVNTSPGDTVRLKNPRSVNSEALQAYWKGQYYLALLANPTRKGKDSADLERKYKQAVAYFEQAIQLDPNYAPAYLAYSDSFEFFHDFVDPSPSSATVLARNRAALMKAVALDDTLPNAHFALGKFFFYYDWNWSGAEREYRRGLELNPNSAEGHCDYADFLNSMGRFDESLKEQQRQLQLNPDLQCEVLSPLLPLESHIERERRYIETHHAVTENYWDLGLLLWKAGRYKEAADVWQDLMKQLGYTDVAQAIGRGYTKDGYTGAMREWVNASESAAKKRYVARILMVYLYGVLGDKERAFEWLERAYAERESSMQSLKVFIAWDPVRSDPRFTEMVRRVGLPQ